MLHRMLIDEARLAQEVDRSLYLCKWRQAILSPFASTHTLLYILQSYCSVKIFRVCHND